MTAIDLGAYFKPILNLAANFHDHNLIALDLDFSNAAIGENCIDHSNNLLVNQTASTSFPESGILDSLSFWALLVVFAIWSYHAMPIRYASSGSGVILLT